MSSNLEDGLPTHRSPHKKIKQEFNTIYKMEPDKWTNVPKVLYDSIGTIVTRWDQFMKQY